MCGCDVTWWWRGKHFWDRQMLGMCTPSVICIGHQIWGACECHRSCLPLCCLPCLTPHPRLGHCWLDFEGWVGSVRGLVWMIALSVGIDENKWVRLTVSNIFWTHCLECECAFEHCKFFKHRPCQSSNPPRRQYPICVRHAQWCQTACRLQGCQWGPVFQHVTHCMPYVGENKQLQAKQDEVVLTDKNSMYACPSHPYTGVWLRRHQFWNTKIDRQCFRSSHTYFRQLLPMVIIISVLELGLHVPISCIVLSMCLLAQTPSLVGPFHGVDSSHHQ